MKNLSLLILLFFVQLQLTAQCEGVVPDCKILSDFECQVNYISIPSVTNPDPDPVNTSPTVGQYNDQPDPFDALIVDYRGPIDLSVFNILSLKMYTNVITTGPLKVKLEGGTSAPIELDIAANLTGQWQDLSVDFSGQAAENHTRVIFFFNAGTTTLGTDLYFIDDVRWTANPVPSDPCSGAVPTANLLNDFECQQNRPFSSCFPIVANPAPNPVNSSALVGYYRDTENAFDNIIIDYNSPIGLALNNTFNLKIRTSVSGPLLVKLEGGTSPATEISTPLSGSGAWEYISVNFSSEANTDHSRIVLFFNAGATTGGTDEYFIDDIMWDSSLPIELLAYTAYPSGKAAELLWETSFEEDALGFYVEHSAGLDEWRDIGFVAAENAATDQRTYAFTHLNPERQNYYRLRMVDLDGSYAYSPIQQVLIDLPNAAFQVYPSPFSDVINLAFLASTPAEVTVSLFDTNGRVLVQQTEKTDGTVLSIRQLGWLTAGSYFIRVQANGNTITSRMIKQ